jgi:hypothetical protein
VHAAYHDQTGEPGFINQDKLTFNSRGHRGAARWRLRRERPLQARRERQALMKALGKRWKRRYKVITNPCGEIVLIMLGRLLRHRRRGAVPCRGAISGEQDGTYRVWDDDAEDASAPPPAR